ncbi:MAG: sulfite exporter TauE/SafE family protein [Myxococcota bacterium]
MIGVVAGLLAGCVHVVSGPDHLAALLPIAIHNRWQAIKTGAVWGLGHGIGVCVVGGLGMGARHLVDVQAISRWSEFLVGLVLVAVGVWAIRRSSMLTIHSHGHSHDHEGHEHGDHEHLHSHSGAAAHSDVDHRHAHAALGVGFLHGAAGVGHLFGVIPALALPASEASIYIVSYLIGAIVSMATFGGFVGFISTRGGPHFVPLLMKAAGLLSIVVGIFWGVSGWPV